MTDTRKRKFEVGDRVQDKYDPRHRSLHVKTVFVNGRGDNVCIVSRGYESETTWNVLEEDLVKDLREEAADA